MYFVSSGICLALTTVEDETMLQLTDDRRKMLVDKLPDAANLAAGALLFGQFLGERAFSIVLAGLGIGIWVFLMACSFALAGEKQL